LILIRLLYVNVIRDRLSVVYSISTGKSSSACSTA
jgi:hypothetical protein